MQVIEVNCFEAYSPKGFLYLTTSTEDPSVDTYMIFTVRTNVFVDEINYLVSYQSIDPSKSDKDLCEHMYNTRMHSSMIAHRLLQYPPLNAGTWGLGRPPLIEADPLEEDPLEEDPLWSPVVTRQMQSSRMRTAHFC